MAENNTERITRRQPNNTANEKRRLVALVNKCYSYLDSNFHKFDKKTRTHIALEIVKKAIPQKLEYGLDEELSELVRQADTNRLKDLLCQLTSKN